MNKCIFCLNEGLSFHTVCENCRPDSKQSDKPVDWEDISTSPKEPMQEVIGANDEESFVMVYYEGKWYTYSHEVFPKYWTRTPPNFRHYDEREDGYYPCIGVDNLQHICKPHENVTYCGMKVKHKKVDGLLGKEEYMFSCYDCTY